MAFVWLLALGKASALVDYDDWRPDPSMYPPGRVVAVDLGNTNSCVAGYSGSETMFQVCIPSWVAFADDATVLVGEDAMNYAAVNPKAAVSGFKRLLGERLTWMDLARRVNENLPFKFVEKDVSAHAEVKPKEGMTRHVGVQEMATTLFSKLKATADEYLGGRPVEAAILTLPWHHRSKDASSDVAWYAGTDAGFRAMKLLSEPVAAAIAYGLRTKLREEGNVLVLHVGGGTAEASVMTFVGGVFHYLSVHYDPFFGGHDFDRRIMDHFIQLIRAKHGKDISNDVVALEKLRMACERAKKTLSDQDRAQVTVESIVDAVDLSETLTRAKFEELNHDLFLKIVDMVDKVVSHAKQNLDDDIEMIIDEVVLIGGSTMIPRLRELVKDYFGGTKKLHTRLKPDEVVALGALLYSKSLYLGSSWRSVSG